MVRSGSLAFLVGGFNPSEKYQSNWIISSNRDENKTYLKQQFCFGEGGIFMGHGFDGHDLGVERWQKKGMRNLKVNHIKHVNET